MAGARAARWHTSASWPPLPPQVAGMQLLRPRLAPGPQARPTHRPVRCVLGGSRLLRRLRPLGTLSKIQKDIAKNHQVRRQYTIQVGENELVLKELELLSDGADVYRVIGPVLVKQDLADAKANVEKRIEYISAELKRMDRALKDLEEKQNSKKESVYVLKIDKKLVTIKRGSCDQFLTKIKIFDLGKAEDGWIRIFF
ncbi:prefoldin subunit 6-like [Miscanthus floridulus]|uniref:prefoldin subunit 6-like n=1 Tax=Miscanthus floridulus TaxID=154761 RepID=UPI003458AF98